MVVGSIEISERSCSAVVWIDGNTGADAGKEGIVVAVGKIKGFKEFEPEGNFRILRLLHALASFSAGNGRPQEAAPFDEADMKDVGLDDDDGADRIEVEVLERGLKKPDRLDCRGDIGDFMASSELGD